MKRLCDREASNTTVSSGRKETISPDMEPFLDVACRDQDLKNPRPFSFGRKRMKGTSSKARRPYASLASKMTPFVFNLLSSEGRVGSVS
jgi:hypothetical protein